MFLLRILVRRALLRQERLVLGVLWTGLVGWLLEGRLRRVGVMIVGVSKDL